MSGEYSGKVDGQPVTVDLEFGPEGVVTANIVYDNGASARARGDFQMSGDTATIMLMEQGVMQPLVYSGEVAPRKASGRVTSGGRNIGRFSIQR